MELTIDLGVKRDLTDVQMRTLDEKLRGRIPELIGWSYSPLTGELTLDFGEVEDEALAQRIQNWMVKAEGIRALRFRVLEMMKEWVE